MKIKSFLSRYRSDYTAIMVCEHCGYEQRDKYGYDDDNYHTNVIPKMHCGKCGKNRAGEERAKP